jgi:hypothetical protein
MPREQYGVLLNELLAGERAGTKLAAAYANELPPDCDAWASLCIIQRNRARNCSVLIHTLLEDGLEPGTAVAGYYALGLGVRAWSARLRFLIGTHEWSVQRIAANVSRVVSEAGRRALKAMLDAHRADMASCHEELRLLGRLQLPRSGP